jgi:sulfur-carrier protein adenylyltransferase/sulfurtransferase
MKEITVQELKALIDNNENFQLIDVREQHEVDAANINGEHIPMGEVMDHLDKISKDKKVVIHCRSGARSGSIVQALETNFAYTNLYNLKGGIIAWAREIDNSMFVV